jgi:CDP-2,3-bis-(O-geranylgeranyl)-sn-glycerol synthase
VELISAIINAVWILIPVYAANGFPVLSRGKRPIDFGKKFSDGERIFGDGKTWEGLLAGLIAGTLYGCLLWLLYPYANFLAIQNGFEILYINPFIGFILSLGALLGDLIGSFIKRRLKMTRGEDAPLLDQENFILGAVLLSLPFIKISLEMFIIMILFTPIIHRFANISGYLIKMKSVPW